MFYFPKIDAVTKLVPPPFCNYKPYTWIQLMLQLIHCCDLYTCPHQNFLTKLLSVEQGKSLENCCRDNLGNWNVYFETWSTVRGSRDYSVCHVTATWWWNEYDSLLRPYIRSYMRDVILDIFAPLKWRKLCRMTSLPEETHKVIYIWCFFERAS